MADEASSSCCFSGALDVKINECISCNQSKKKLNASEQPNNKNKATDERPMQLEVMSRINPATSCSAKYIASPSEKTEGSNNGMRRVVSTRKLDVSSVGQISDADM
eukprot:CAMPEP_0184396060 /NCGR_PEP_ID=MMETSP0007-20130409/46734_1 /TAXON_ID=97485 /ORGANISM="Prymnesium parvum, Strain Texoma1" /LENGTH=105 /DNA_ID=CAMNT_0026748601 /DNA_START=192 /DNA_END=509 /DNA_ORIENTATION=-